MLYWRAFLLISLFALLIFGFHIVFGLAFAVWFAWKQHKQPDFKFFILSILLKVIATILFVFLHQKLYPQYTPDYILIFEDACKLSNFIHQSSLEYLKIIFDAPADIENWHLASQPRAFFAVKIYSVLVWLTGQHFWLSMFYASAASHIAIWFIYKKLSTLFPQYRKAALISFLFLPSLTFWASASSKETLLMIFLSILSIIFLKFVYQKWKWWEGIIFFIVLWWLVLLKYYYAFGVALMLCLYGFLHYTQKLSFFARIILCFALFGATLGLTFLHPNLRLENFVSALYDNYTLILAASPQGSALDLGLAPSWQSLIVHSPLGLCVGIFAPLPHQISKWQMLPIAIENLLVLILFVCVLFKIIQQQRSTIKRMFHLDAKGKMLLFSVFVFAIVMATFLGLSSPNFGALSRYRVGYMPFLIFGLLVIWQYLSPKSKPHK